MLDQLILVAADIPVWAITTGRSNYLASCLRRFHDTVLFVNDADMVLRLAPLRIGQIDSHGGYFRGRFCLDLLYEIALRGIPAEQKRRLEIHAEQKQHRIS